MTMKKIVLASKNEGKIRELSAMLNPLDLHVVSAAEFNMPDIEEPFETFVENALAKARAVSAFTGLPALADDSGLCVEALKYAPGIHSARFAGNGASDTQNNLKLLTELKNNPNRNAFYYCVLVMVSSPSDPQPLIADGRWYGQITQEPAGDNGFGYDPLFYVPALGVTSAQLSPEEKNRISHRGIAIKKLVEILKPSEKFLG